ncbi:uncharacterized protein EV154DRAFT_505010 [Mucor mucedo]|uniref:uncharacterized protein n=1 Tax=Mucor mucedo TaxID=29922 RepID=UPI00221E8CC1|nr:uncharacterized protein EV154DRAFT_505010 [Mucor mucedo]KAI7892403.1 hypothetical protein EV154DRAFT_505010 [Mucor mucedo]
MFIGRVLPLKTTTAAHNSITAAVTATGAHTVVATTAGLPPVDEILPYLISFFGGMIPTELGALASQLSTLPLTGLSGLPSAAISSLLTNGLSALPTGTSMAPSVQTTGVSTPPLTNFPINTLGPSLMTTHTTVTSLVTMTPNATDGSDNISSHGSKSLVDPWILSVACILLLTSHLFILV